jgi:hypothetical protein
MNEPENTPQSAPRSVDGNETCESLRRQINLLFGALVLTSFTLTAYLGLQARRASMDYTLAKPRAEEAVKLFQQDNVTVEAALAKLADFGRSHPDFQTNILNKYKISKPAAVSSAPAATPAAPQAPKK